MFSTRTLQLLFHTDTYSSVQYLSTEVCVVSFADVLTNFLSFSFSTRTAPLYYGYNCAGVYESGVTQTTQKIEISLILCCIDLYFNIMKEFLQNGHSFTFISIGA